MEHLRESGYALSGPDYPDIADYVVPVNADIGAIEVGFIDKADPVLNTIGAKGLGEVAMVRASLAIANAIFHATGKRLRKMPIRVGDLLEAGGGVALRRSVVRPAFPRPARSFRLARTCASVRDAR